MGAEEVYRNAIQLINGTRQPEIYTRNSNYMKQLIVSWYAAGVPVHQPVLGNGTAVITRRVLVTARPIRL
jgi:hypothetical protein